MPALRSLRGDPYAPFAAVPMFTLSRARDGYSLLGQLAGPVQMKGAECIGSPFRHQAVVRVEGDVIDNLRSVLHYGQSEEPGGS